MTIEQLKKRCFNQEVFPDDILNWIAKENLWNIWIPKSYGGLEMSFSEGLNKLRFLSEIDGSLGWTITLCSGANFFFGNLRSDVANAIFINPKNPVCFGGSGGIFGTAEKKDNGYIISGTWKYATGAPYLTHFTLNAKILDAGKEVLDENGACLIRSFVISKDNVEIIKDWNSMGLKATATHSFKVKNKWVPEKFSFVYNKLHHNHPIFKINFAVFADLTLWVNYLGIAVQFYKEAQNVIKENTTLLDKLLAIITKSDAEIQQYALQIENHIYSDKLIPETWMNKIHKEASNSVKALSNAIIKVYPFLGIEACKQNSRLHYVFKDYFTATQHHIFSKKTNKLSSKTN